MYIHKQIRTVKQDAHFSFQYNYCSWFWIKQEDHKFLTFLCHIVTTVCCLWGVQTSSLYLNGTLPRSPSECISSLALTRRPREVSQHALTSVLDLFEFVLETQRHWHHLFWKKSIKLSKQVSPSIGIQLCLFLCAFICRENKCIWPKYVLLEIHLI